MRHIHIPRLPVPTPNRVWWLRIRNVNWAFLEFARLPSRRVEIQKRVVRVKRDTTEKGTTLIPTRLYFKGGRVKCELALARGKQDWDKRETERRREADKEARAAIARIQRR